MIKVILFDMDDTLIKTFETKKEALKALGRKYYHVELSDEEIRAHWGKPLRSLLQSLYKHAEDIEEAVDRYIIERDNFPTALYEDTLSTLDELSKKYLLGILTAKSRLYIKDDLKLTGISENLFFVIQTEEDTDVHKPDPAVFNHIVATLEGKGIQKSEVVYVGDSLSDFYAARGAGLQFYGIAERTVTKADFESQGAKIIPSLKELLTLLKN